jgi:hypothetical protein
MRALPSIATTYYMESGIRRQPSQYSFASGRRIGWPVPERYLYDREDLKLRTSRFVSVGALPVM